MHIVLYEPEIPQNTGNIARTCAATGSVLHLIKPLGFSLEDKYLKRAGLDYWRMMRYEVHENFEELLEKYPGARMHFLSTKRPEATPKRPTARMIFWCSVGRPGVCRKVCSAGSTTAAAAFPWCREPQRI